MRLHALTLVSELGTDFSKWPTVKQFTSWLGLCPNWQKTGGKVQSSRRVGARTARRSFAFGGVEPDAESELPSALPAPAAFASGAPKAITATAHKLARIVYHLMRHGVAYMKQTEAAYAEQVRERLEKQLRRRAQELGFEVKKIEPAETATATQ